MKKLNDFPEGTTDDIIIIGGSIAGNYLASLLADSGLAVRVIEEHKTVGQPLECAGIVSSKLATLMDIPRQLIRNRVSTAKIFGPSGKSISIRTRDNPLVLDRAGLDVHFYNKAKASGVAYNTGEKIIDVENSESNVLVTTNKGSLFKASMIAGCDGANSLIARENGIKNDFLVGKQAIIRFHGKENPYKLDLDTCELHFNPRWNDLFGWVIPVDDLSFRVGLATRTKVASRFKEFFQSRFGVALEGANDEGQFQIIAITGGTVPVGLPKKNCFDRALLLGDACCQVKATTGGGLVMLAIAATRAAKAIKACFARGDFSRAFIAKHYQKRCKRAIGWSLMMHYLIHLGLKSLAKPDFDFLFDLANEPRIQEDLLRTADMDFPLAFFLKILLYPRFYRWLLRFLARNVSLLKRVVLVLLTGKVRNSN